MSGWGMAHYYSRGERIMRDIWTGDRPHSIIATRHMLKLDQLDYGKCGPNHFGLFKKDRDVLRVNFISHWGPICVAGKRLELIYEKPQIDF